MFKLKSFGIAAAVALTTVGAMASNFRAADQVYVPAAGKLVGGSGTFISDVFLSNVSDDAVTVTVIYSAGAGGTQQSNFPAINLAPRERKEFSDFFVSALGLQAGFGQLVFNACKQGSDCGPATQDPSTGISPNFRNITVESRIYSIPAGTTLAQNPPTLGQLFSGIPWYNFVSSDSASVGLDKVFITGLRNNGSPGQAGTYRGNIGLVNASQFSTTDLVVKLFAGNGTQIGSEFKQTLSPLGHTQLNVGTMFPAFTGSTATNSYVTVEQRNNVPTSDAATAGCPTGCPAFFAYGSVLDNASGDPTTLEPQYLKALGDAQIACIYSTTATCKGTPKLRRAVKR